MSSLAVDLGHAKSPAGMLGQTERLAAMLGEAVPSHEQAVLMIPVEELPLSPDNTTSPLIASPLSEVM